MFEVVIVCLTGLCGQQPGARVSREDSKGFGTNFPCEAYNQGLTLVGGMGRLDFTLMLNLSQVKVSHDLTVVLRL